MSDGSITEGWPAIPFECCDKIARVFWLLDKQDANVVTTLTGLSNEVRERTQRVFVVVFTACQTCLHQNSKSGPHN